MKYTLKRLEDIGRALGFRCEREVPTRVGRIDLVWFYEFEKKLPKLGDKLPVIGFEVETSWRTRKHIKGDIMNLLELNPVYGVVLLISRGFTTESKLRGNIDFASKVIKGISGISRIQVWTEEDIEEIYQEISKRDT